MSPRKYRYQPPLPSIAWRLAAVLFVAALAAGAALGWRGPLEFQGRQWISGFRLIALFWGIVLVCLCIASGLVWLRLAALGKPGMVVLHDTGLSMPQRVGHGGEFIPYDSMLQIEVRGSGAARQIEIGVAGGSVCIAQRCLADGLAFDSLVDALADRMSLASERRAGAYASPIRPVAHRQVPGAITARPSAEPPADRKRSAALGSF